MKKKMKEDTLLFPVMVSPHFGKTMRVILSLEHMRSSAIKYR